MNYLDFPRRWVSSFVLAMLILVAAAPCTGGEFIPVSEVVVCAPLASTDAETLAIRHFAQSVKQFSGIDLPHGSSLPSPGNTALVTGNRRSREQLFEQQAWHVPSNVVDELDQSYVLAALPVENETPRRLIAAGFGDSREPRSYLGMGYALGDLLRRLEHRDGVWGFVIPSAPIISSPAMPNRTLYLMNSSHMNPGLSLEFMSTSELQAYADFLVDARYSRVSFWQWSSFYLYPGNEHGEPPTSLGGWTAEAEQDLQARRARNQMIHRVMRQFFDYARRRGLEVYHQLAPMHANVDLLPADPKFVATGYYGRTSICWAQPEGRELARRMAQAEMEYFGPVDGYNVWFYDPGGCFCATCYPNQADHLFQQFSMVEELAKTISPGAEFQAVLWPTWCFHDYQDRGIPYKSIDEVQVFVRRFLEQMQKSHPPRAVSIMDTCELEQSNIYNGLVKPEAFKRTAFVHTVMGGPSESAYPFASFRIGDLVEVMGKARDRKLDDAVFFIQYAVTNMPAVFAFADTLYEQQTTPEETAGRYTKTIAKGDATHQLTDLLLTLDAVHRSPSYEAKEEALQQAQNLGESVDQSPLFFGNRDWLKGQLLAQEHYLGMARAENLSLFDEHLAALKQKVGAIPMYQDYVAKVLNADLAGQHVQTFWRAPLNDSNRVGLPLAK